MCMSVCLHLDTHIHVYESRLAWLYHVYSM